MNFRKIALGFLVLSVILVSACNEFKSEEGFEREDLDACQKDVTGRVHEKPYLNIDWELEKYCESEKLGKGDIIADNNGYKDAIGLNVGSAQVKKAYYPELRSAMKWLKETTDQESIVMAWIDYSAMIEVFSERKAAPSAQESDYNDTTKKIARVYTTDNPVEAVGIMRSFNAEYILIPKGIVEKFPVLYKKSYDRYKYISDNEDNRYKADELDHDSITYSALYKKPISKFKRVYSDDDAVIYQIAIS